MKALVIYTDGNFNLATKQTELDEYAQLPDYLVTIDLDEVLRQKVEEL